MEKNSDTKRLKAYGDVLQKFGPDPPTRDIWDRESQPGGFLHTAFGGRMVPYEQAPQAWREIKSRVAAGPDDQELAEAGLTPEQIRDARRQRVLQGVYGKIEPKTGKRWTPGGALEDIPGAGKDTQNERQSRITARTGKDAADKALAYFEKNQGLGGTLKQMFGDEWEVPMGHQLFKGGLKVGGFGDAGEAMKSSRQAVLELNFALSGKSVSNAELEEFLRLYMPSSMDSFKRQKWKLTQIKSYFDRVLSSKSDDEHGEIVRKAIREAGGSVPEGKNGDRLPPSGRPDPSRMSDDELLRELSRQ